jgi:hypothetical protein
VIFRCSRRREDYTFAIGINEILFMRVLCLYFALFITLNLLHVPLLLPSHKLGIKSVHHTGK